MKEFFRKKIVGLKRSPQLIPMLFIIISCVIYTFSLTIFSNASIGLYEQGFFEQLISELKASGAEIAFPIIENAAGNYVIFPLYRNPAIYVFIVTLFSILLPISFLSVYKKNKVNWFMLSIAIAMIVVMIACDVLYICSLKFYMGDVYGQIDTDGVLQLTITRSIVHLVSLAISLCAILTRPLYAALLNKIDTSVEDEYDKLMDRKSDDELMLDLDDEA